MIDFEYDPVLNYSAGLLGASKVKQDETDMQHFCRLQNMQLEIATNLWRAKDLMFHNMN